MFKKIFNTQTFKQSQITIAGTLINGGLGALFYILLARFLGPVNFGLLTVSIAVLTLISDIVDFGTNTGIVKHVPLRLKENKTQALKFLKLSLEFKILIWILVLAIGLVISPAIADNIFNKPELTVPLRLVMFGVGGALLLSFATSSLQAYQKYFIWSTVNILTNFLRLFFIIVLFSFGGLNLFNSLVIYIILPFFGFSLALLFLPIREIAGVKQEFSVARQLFKYNFWVGIFTIISALSARLDTFLGARLLSSFDVGIYGAANQLVQVVPQLIGALGVVAAPKFASFTSSKDMIVYLKKFQLFVLGLSFLALLSIPLAIYFIPPVFGIQYSSVTAPFVILLVAMLIFLISLPIHISIIFYFGRPDIFVWVSVGHLLIIGLIGYMMISNFGVIGAALTVVVGTTFNFLVPLFWFLLKIRK